MHANVILILFIRQCVPINPSMHRTDFFYSVQVAITNE